MRILFDQAVHDHRNQGNNALLEVALHRLWQYWPDASMSIVSIAPHLCRTFFPGALPVSPDTLQSVQRKSDVLHRFLPRSFWLLLFELRQRRAAGGGPLPAPALHSASEAPHQEHDQSLDAIDIHVPGNGTLAADHPPEATDNALHAQSAIAEYDLYVATGGGYMCDSDKRFLFPLFDRLEAAIDSGVATVMVGQGIGPLTDQDLLQRAAQVLPHLDYIMIREEQVARPLLERLGVPSSKVIMTGDDAIELAYNARRRQLGTGIGLSLRVAHYTGVQDNDIQSIRPVVLQAAHKYSADLISVPIDINETDSLYGAEIMAGYEKTSSPWRKFEYPVDLVQRTGRCRIMVAGTFHGAVFALGQGIPVIALAKSVEYRNKLTGLTTQFGTEGCQVIDLRDNELQEDLAMALDRAWLAADQLRPQLLADAKRQIDLGHFAYQMIFDVMERRVVDGLVRQ